MRQLSCAAVCASSSVVNNKFLANMLQKFMHLACTGETCPSQQDSQTTMSGVSHIYVVDTSCLVIKYPLNTGYDTSCLAIQGILGKVLPSSFLGQINKYVIID